MQKGKMDGYSKCVFKTGDLLTGTIKDEDFVGEAVYEWRRAKSCPTCPKRYIGTFHKGTFAKGKLLLSNGENIELKYYPTTKGCLVWNENPQKDETITWTGECKDGYANGEGILTFKSKEATETTQGTLKYGLKEGKIVVDAKYTRPCQNCLVHYEGTFKFNRPIEGVATLGNGRKIHQNEQRRQNTPLEDAVVDFIATRTLHYYSTYVFH